MLGFLLSLCVCVCLSVALSKFDMLVVWCLVKDETRHHTTICRLTGQLQNCTEKAWSIHLDQLLQLWCIFDVCQLSDLWCWCIFALSWWCHGWLDPLLPTFPSPLLRRKGRTQSHDCGGDAWTPSRQNARDQLHQPPGHRKRLVWCSVPGQTCWQQRQHSHQESVTGQEIQGQLPVENVEYCPNPSLLLWIFFLSHYLSLSFSLSPSAPQNRELQIMRRLDHCNIIRLQFFFYSNGDGVSSFFALAAVLPPCLWWWMWVV